MSQMTPSQGPASTGSAEAGRAVDASQGWVWITGGFELFKKQPGMCIALFVVLMVIVFALAFIPLLGALAIFVLAPVFGGGLMLGCQALARGGALEMGHLFAGFKTHTGNLIALGGLLVLGVIVVVLPPILIVGTGAILAAISGQGGGVAAIGGTFAIAWLIAMGIGVLVSMAFWFAPALVALRGVAPIAAIQQSFFGCLKNIIPFLIYGIVVLVIVGILLAITFVISLVLGPFAAVVYILGWLVMGPTLIASTYLAYRDIYSDS